MSIDRLIHLDISEDIFGLNRFRNRIREWGIYMLLSAHPCWIRDACPQPPRCVVEPMVGRTPFQHLQHLLYEGTATLLQLAQRDI